MKKSKICGIYKITHIESGRCYIGLSVDVLSRWKVHAFHSKASNTHLYNAIRKYGIQCFAFTVVEECPKECLSAREIFWIKECNAFGNGFNLNEGGDSPSQTPESRKKKSEALKGKKKTPEHNAKVSAANKGQEASDEQRILFSIAAKARWADPVRRAALMASRAKKRVCSQETKLKLSKAQSKYMSVPENRSKISTFWKKNKEHNHDH
jgi:group I intron endonuclease